MTDKIKEIAERIYSLSLARSRQIIPQSVSIQQEFHRHTIKMIGDMLAEYKSAEIERLQGIIGRAKIASDLHLGDLAVTKILSEAEDV